MSQRTFIADDFALPQYTMVALSEYNFLFKILLEDLALFRKGLEFYVIIPANIVENCVRVSRYLEQMEKKESSMISGNISRLMLVVLFMKFSTAINTYSVN